MNSADYPEVLSDLAYQLGKSLVKEGIAKSQAETAAKSAAAFISEHWGGQLIYFPKAAKFNIANRDSEIRKKWNGKNILDLCREYSLSRQRLYQILKPPPKKRRADKEDQSEIEFL